MTKFLVQKYIHQINTNSEFCLLHIVVVEGIALNY